MRIYPEEFESKIGFTQIRNKIKAYCQSPASESLADKISCSDDADKVTKRLQETNEMRQLLMLAKGFSVRSFPDITKILEELSRPHSVLQDSHFQDIREVLKAVHIPLKYLSNSAPEKYPRLKEMSVDLMYPHYILDEIDRVFTNKGEIRATASNTLKELFTQQKNTEENADKRIQAVMKRIQAESWLSTDQSVVSINGHMAVPIDTTYKRKIQGYWLDESATGKVTYMEPAEIVVLNNEIREINHQIKREIQEILKGLTDKIREYQGILGALSAYMSNLDLIYAKAKLAMDMDAILPAVNTKMHFKYHQAKHPLLYLSYKKSGKDVVPFDLDLHPKTSSYLISGPNAGGKSVALQSVGLIQYMFQCGLLVPCGGNTDLGIFRYFMLDMGDDQSIDDDLSTYSSHLKKLKFFLKHANASSLVLIDELGTGTEPEIGGAIAESILEVLLSKKVYGIFTTHFNNLKHFASSHPGIENAAMLIDNQKMAPLFQLKTGIPGSSYSFEIAARSGIPGEVIELAKSSMGKEQYLFDKYLRQVIRDRKYWEDKRRQIKKEEQKLQAAANRQEVAYQSFLREQEAILKKTQKQVEERLRAANKQIENTIKEIKENQADREKTKKARAKLSQAKEQLSKPPERSQSLAEKNLTKTISEFKAQAEKKPATVKTNNNEIRIGSIVDISELDQSGEVIDIGEDKYVVQLGHMITTVDKGSVKKSPNQKKERSTSGSSYVNPVHQFSPYLDIRGMRADDALKSLMDFIDNAIVVQAAEVKILHGKGSGILRSVVRDYLATVKEVGRYYNADIRQGGDGITVVEMSVG